MSVSLELATRLSHSLSDHSTLVIPQSLSDPSFSHSVVCSCHPPPPCARCGPKAKQQMEQKARRRRVPAFGEWNYNYYGSAELATPAAAVPFERSYAAAPELEARSDVWFKYSPPPRKPPPVSRKVRRPPEKSYGGKRPRAAMPARASDGVVPSSSVPRTPAKMSTAGTARAARVVQRVDADLYQVPPPEFVHDDDMRPRWKQQRRKKASRSLWMGCFGFSCRPAE